MFPVRLNQFLVTPLGLLLTFRTQQSIARFNEAVTNWGKISSLCRSLSRTLFYHDERVPRVLGLSCGFFCRCRVVDPIVAVVAPISMRLSSGAS